MTFEADLDFPIRRYTYPSLFLGRELLSDRTNSFSSNRLYLLKLP